MLKVNLRVTPFYGQFVKIMQTLMAIPVTEQAVRKLWSHFCPHSPGVYVVGCYRLIFSKT